MNSIMYWVIRMVKNEKKLLKRITRDPEVMTGKPVIKGTRLTVQHIISLLAECASMDDILEEYEGLSEEDIKACLLYASN